MRGVVVPNSEPVHIGSRNSQFEHITANASVITARNRPRARSAGMPMTIAATTPTSGRADDGREPRHLHRHVPEVERHRDVEAGAQHDHRERAEADERELPERELAGPAGERRDRQRDERVDDDLGPEELLRPLRQEERQQREEPEQHDEADQRAGAARTRATAAAPGSASPGPTATSRCRRGGCGRRPARARARRRTGRGRRSTGRASRRSRARCARTRRPRCRRRCVIGSDCMRAMSATTSARNSSDGPIATAPAATMLPGVTPSSGATRMPVIAANAAGDRPHDRRRALDADAVDPRGVGVRRRRAHREAERRPRHEQRRAR